MTLATQVTKENQVSDLPFQLRGGAFTLVVLRIADLKSPELFPRLADKVAQAPNFFRNAPVVLDLRDLADSPPFNIAELGRRLRQHMLIPIGVQNATEEQARAAVNAGLSLFPEGRSASFIDRSAPEPTDLPKASVPTNGQSSEPKAAPTTQPTNGKLVGSETGKSLLVTHPVRSGRQVYAAGGDLVVMAAISTGAELLADGHIHVYGALRGRALAGVNGDTTARIFCRSLEAELISIAGYWRVREDIPEEFIGRAAQIYLLGERIVIEPLA